MVTRKSIPSIYKINKMSDAELKKEGMRLIKSANSRIRRANDAGLGTYIVNVSGKQKSKNGKAPEISKQTTDIEELRKNVKTAAKVLSPIGGPRATTQKGLQEAETYMKSNLADFLQKNGSNIKMGTISKQQLSDFWELANELSKYSEEYYREVVRLNVRIKKVINEETGEEKEVEATMDDILEAMLEKLVKLEEGGV